MELTKINAKDDMILLKSDTGESGWFRFIDMLFREGKEYAALADEGGEVCVMEFIEGAPERYREIEDDAVFDDVCAMFAEADPEDFDY